MANPSPKSMKDRIGDSSNGGVQNTDIGRGQTVMRAFPLDRSTNAGSAATERGGSMGGGVNNLDHSLKGASANQTGRS